MKTPLSSAYPLPWTPIQVERLLEIAYGEDLQGGDITAQAIFVPHQETTARAIAKAPTVVCGLSLAKAAFTFLDPDTRFQALVEEGTHVSAQTPVFLVEGRVHSLLAAERVSLNLLQHLCGIASKARFLSSLVHDLPVRLTDTRKTLAGLRAFQRYAVRVGGCFNHRYNLGSGALIKENHIRAAGSIASAVSKVRLWAPHLLKVEIEVTTLDEVRQALDAKADILLLDNMTPALLREAVAINQGRALLEASGGIDETTLRHVAETGVDFISIGALTHSVKAADISLLFDLP